MTKKTTRKTKQKRSSLSNIELSPKKRAKLDKFEGYLNALTNIIKVIRG